MLITGSLKSAYTLSYSVESDVNLL